ncbi:hypothetical protein SNK04_006396 [Fusarium graminearum]
MKHSTATILALALAHGIIAAPSILSKLSRENVRAIHASPGEDYTLVDSLLVYLMIFVFFLLSL